MTESLEASADIDQIRRELGRLRRDVQEVGDQVKQVDAKVERSRTAQLGAMATALSGDLGVQREVILSAAGMSVADIATVLHKSENAVRIVLSRARRQTKPRSKAKKRTGG